MKGSTMKCHSASDRMLPPARPQLEKPEDGSAYHLITWMFTESNKISFEIVNISVLNPAEILQSITF